MKRWRAILDFSIELYDLGDVQAIDATGVDRARPVRALPLTDMETSSIGVQILRYERAGEIDYGSFALENS